MADRIKLFGIMIDRLSMDQAVARLLEWIEESAYDCRYVVTPNVDHIVKLEMSETFRDAYRDAALVLVDGKPVRLVSILLGKPLPETVPGSDLGPALFDASKSCGGLSVFLLGAAEGVAEKAALAIKEQWPWVTVCGVFSPPMGFDAVSPASETAITMIREAAPDVLVVGLGAPKQELWVHAVRGRLHVKVVLCIGATIDFLAGEKQRAPVWMRRFGLEWLHRMLSEPRRLLLRYIHDAWVFPRLIIAEWRRTH